MEIGDHTASWRRLSGAFRCAMCDRQFASRKYLSMHIALHKMAATELPPSLPTVASVGSDVNTSKHQATSAQWSCPICAKHFSQNSNFRNHVRTHSDERPYVCVVCLIGFKERYHLKKHMLFKHSPGQLNEACRHCSKRFKDLTAVRAHERTHSDARPYSCSRCAKSFKTSECLWHHENRSKTCSRTVSDSQHLEADSSRRRQRHTRAGLSLSMTTDASSTTEAAATVATLLTPFVDSSGAEMPLSLQSTAKGCTSDARAAIASASAKPPTTKRAEPLNGSLWRTSNNAASQLTYDDDLSRSANIFHNYRAITADAPDAGSSGETETVGGYHEQFWNRAASLDLVSWNDCYLQPSFVECRDNRAAGFTRTVCGYSERRPLYRQNTSAYGTQQTRQSGANREHNKHSVPICSTLSGTGSIERSLKQSLANNQHVTAGALCGLYLPTAVVSPVRRTCHLSTLSSLHTLPSPPAENFHLPPIETFAPRHRPPTATWPSLSSMPTCHLQPIQQQCPTVAKYLITPSVAENRPTHANSYCGKYPTQLCFKPIYRY